MKEFGDEIKTYLYLDVFLKVGFSIDFSITGYLTEIVEKDHTSEEKNSCRC